jgi:hypothetical protein
MDRRLPQPPQAAQSRSQCETLGDGAGVPAVLTVTVGAVVFNNTATELGDFARTLYRAVARLIDREAQATPSRTTVVSILLHNNGDAPVDPTLFSPDARLTNSAINLGFGRAHNLLMAEAFAGGTEFYVASNPDGMFHPDALIEMIAVARRCKGRALVEASLFPEELPKAFGPLTLDTPWAAGCCLLVPAEIYRAIGGFDENIFMFCEDVDLSWRAREAGFAAKHAPRAWFSHPIRRYGTNPVTRQVYLDAARYFAAKCGNAAFVRKMDSLMAANGYQPKALPQLQPSKPLSSVADFSHGLDFAPQRWDCPAPIPFHRVSKHSDDDQAIDVIVRFHDPAQIRRLSRCLFSLYGQRHQPIQVLLMLQGLDDTGVATVNACVDAFDWSMPRRRPIVNNVAVETPGDHRAKLWNSGLDVGRARYVGFCDFDDIVYSAGYSYLLHRLQFTDAAAAFASALHVDCTPMHEFDFVFAKRLLKGRDRYDFFVGSFCPANCVLVDRSRISQRNLYVEESLQRNEDYCAFATIIATHETDWSSIGTPVAEYIHRTDGSNTVMSHRNDPASVRDWEESNQSAQRVIAGLTAKVPVSDLVRMRVTERELRQQIASMEQSMAWRASRPINAIEWVIRGIRRRWKRR